MASISSRLTEPSPYRRLWPLGLLVGVQVALFALFARQPEASGFLSPTRFSAFVALGVLSCGVAPAILRPGFETMLAGCLASLMAGILVTPISLGQLSEQLAPGPLLVSLPPYLVLRLGYGLSMPPLAFHLLTRFPQRYAIRTRVIFSLYLATAAAAAFLLAASAPDWRQAGTVWVMAWSFGLLGAALALLLKTSRSPDPGNRRAAQQARLLFFSLLLAVLPALLRPLGLLAGTELIPYNLFLAFQLTLPLCLAYTVLRTDLFNIDAALRRTVVYGGLSLLVLVFYFGLTALVAGYVARYWPWFSGAAAVISLLAAAVLFDPARRRLQHWIDRALYPDLLRFRTEVQRAQDSLSRVVSRGEVLRLVQEDLPPRLGAAWAYLTLSPEPDVPDPAQADPAWNSQLMVGGRALGRYWLGPRKAGPSYDHDEQAMLSALVRQAALALAYADTIDQLQRLNRELEARVETRTAQVLAQQRALAGYEERQRLARDLHDSVSQSLFSMNLSARALRKLVRRDPPSAETGLQELEAAAQQALAEMRTLLAQLRTPIAEGVAQPSPIDLVSLLQQHLAEAGQLPEQALPVSLHAPPQLPLPAPLANDLLLLVKEALHNVRKHAGASRAVLAVQVKDDRLVIQVIDDGLGFDPLQVPPDRYGLRGMKERLQAYQGEVLIDAQPGRGTVIQVTLPLPAALQN